MHKPKKFIEHPFAYHEEIELQVEDISNLGAGIGRINNWVVMVPYSLPGETIRARVFRNHANYSEADLVEVIKPSEHRIEPECPLFGMCGGCQFQHWEYSQQLEWKRNRVLEHFARIGSLQVEVQPTIPSPRTYGYRSKLTPHYQRWVADEEFPIGFLHTAQRSRIIDVPHCPIATDAINEALPEVRLQTRKKTPNKRKNRGATLLLRDCREGVETDPNEIISTCVGTTTYQFRAGEFFQNNPFILETFARYVVEAAATESIEHLVDVYCGVGLFALFDPKRFSTVTGIEVSAAAITLAESNARMNRVTNSRFLTGEAETIFARADTPSETTSIILDPPRRGCDPDFLRQLLEFQSARIVYVSCDPSTQARDVKFLCEGGYHCHSVQPFDLFPQTRHIENIVVLDKK